MLPTIHLSATFILWFLLQFLGIKAPFLFISMLVSGVLIDVDILIVHPHRLSIMHTPFFWIIISLILVFISPIHSLSVFLASQTHLLFDMVDGEIMLFYPIKKKMYGANIIVKRYGLDPYKNKPIDFAQKILKTPEIIVSELFIDSIALFLFIYVFNLDILSILLN